jgi:LCP family protein required for cell wall assembly
MSDAEDADPGIGAGDNPWLTRKPKPASPAAPWERGSSDVADGAGDGGTGDHGGGELDAQGDGTAAPIPTVRVSEVPDLTQLAERPVDDIDEVPVGRGKARRRWLRAMVFAGRGAFALTAVTALGLTGCGWQWSTSKNESLNTVVALDPNSTDIRKPSAQLGDENFLIVGIDSRAGANGGMGAGTTADADGARSDTVMLVNIPASRKRVVVVSFPRDLAIAPIQCNSWNNDTGTYGSDTVYTETKLNSAYAFGGPKCLVTVIQKLSGLSINRFIALDFAGFAKLVDAVGGVEVCSTTPLQDHELGTVLEHAGRQKLDGRAALSYVRARQVTTEGNGDYGRIKRQQLFLSSLLRSMISSDVLFSPSKLNDVVNTFVSNAYVDNVKSNDLVDLAESLQGVAAGRITFLTVPTSQTDENGNEPLRVDDTRAIFDAIINNDPLPEENNENQISAPSVAKIMPDRSTNALGGQPGDGADLVDAVIAEPHDVTVHVSNRTDQNGLAATAAGELRQDGFDVLQPDDYPSSLASTTVLFSPGNEQAAATVASSLPNPRVQRVTGMGDVVQVVLGPDFNTVGAPAPSGSAVHVRVTQDSTHAPARLPDDLTVTNAADTSCT